MVERAGKALLFYADHFYNKVMLLHKLRIGILVLLNNCLGNFAEKRAVHSEKASMAGCPAQQAPQNIAPPFVGRLYTVGNQECSPADVVCNDAQGNILLRVFAVSDTGLAADFLHDILHGIHKEQVINPLHDAGKAFKAHSGVNVWLFKRGIAAFAVTVKLLENNVPEFDIAVTVAPNCTGWLAAAVFFAAVKVNLRTGAAGQAAMFPEVILPAEPDYTRRVYTDFFCPDIKRFVIILIDGNPQFVHRHF